VVLRVCIDNVCQVREGRLVGGGVEMSRRRQPLRLVALGLTALALAVAIVPPLYVQHGGNFGGCVVSGRQYREREITLLLGPLGSGLLVFAAVLFLARARQRRSLGMAIAAGITTAVVVLFVSFLVLDHKNYFPDCS